jgi:transglutaminase-like putative cysteine protease
VARTLVLGAVGGALVASNWLRLEERESGWQAVLIVALALVPTLVPGSVRRRAAAGLLAFAIAAGVAFDVQPGLHFPGRVLARFGGGYLDYYDVQLPFDHVNHPRMHGVLLLAIFAFTLLTAIAAAARRPGLAALALVVGAGWPATLLPGHDLERGALLLVGVLAMLVGGRRGRLHGLGYAAAAGTVVVLAAVAASSAPALAKREFLHWQAWDPYTRPAKPIDVRYVWSSRYSGLSFPHKPTTVLRIFASPLPHYWRASVLTAVVAGHWREEVVPRRQTDDVLGEPGLVPLRELDPRGWEQQRVTVEALNDHNLVGGSVPIQFAVPSSLDLEVRYDPSGIAYADNAPRRGDSYEVSSYSPRPTPAQLVRSTADYPPLISERKAYLEVDRHVWVPPFGAPDRSREIDYLFTRYARAPRLRPYRPLYLQAEEVAGGAKSPYAAAVAVERWFRTGGGFVYDQHPPQPQPGVPALTDFVVSTRRGYCQHFAGAMALMLRYLGVPARVAVGFTSGRYDEGKHEWVVADRDAHAWVEVWFRDWGWLPFDPTPGRSGLPGGYSSSSPSFDVNAAAAVLAGKSGLKNFQQGLRSALGFAPKTPLRLSPDTPDLAQLARGGAAAGESHSRAPGLLRLLLLVLAGTIEVISIVKLVRRHARYLTRNPRRLAAACRRDLRDFMRDQGVEVPASATLPELAELIVREFGVEARAFALHASAARFGPSEGAREAARAMRRDLRDLRRRLRGELTRLERLRGLLSLRSLGLA